MLKAVLIVFVLMVSGCASLPDVRAPSVGELPYAIGAGDRLRISTYGEERLTGEFTVGADGMIAFPLLGAVEASDIPVSEFRDRLQQRLAAEALRDPRISVEVVQYRPVFILGEVERPGEYSFVPGMTVPALVAKAGGFTYRANERAVFITRSPTANEVVYRLESATAVAPGDTIRIGERIL